MLIITVFKRLKLFFRRLRLGIYIFRMQPSRRGAEVKRRWLCATYRWLGYPALVQTIEDMIVAVWNEHNH
ncbi:unnamed protein product, partial [Iphiclides podalirius]